MDEQDKSGGLGANFLVEWVAEQPVYGPVVEAVMIGTAGTQAISFVSTGFSVIVLRRQGGRPVHWASRGRATVGESGCTSQAPATRLQKAGEIPILRANGRL